MDLERTTDPSFSPLCTSAPSPDALRNPGLVDVVHWEVADFVSPPEVGGRRWLE